MNVIQNALTMTVVGLITIVSTTTFAEKRSHRQPPPEAFEACEDKSEGDVVSIITPYGDSLQATCKLMTEQLVAVPERDGAHMRRSEKGNEE